MKFIRCFLFFCLILVSKSLNAQITQSDMYPAKASSGASGSSDVLVRMGEMDELFRSTQGKVDELEYKVKSLEEKMDMMKKDFELRFTDLERRGGGSVASSASPSASTANLSGGVDELYKKGLDSVNAGRNKDAISIFNKILTENPEHKLAANAQYWLGEAYYADKDFQRSAVAFAKGYEKYKSGPKGADSLLKLGLSMIELKKTQEACTAFLGVPKEFPKTSEVLKKKATELAKKYSCK
ncbi:MAG: tol-pal system protein YbgF [Alphaproteobacteria bacterium]|nr:tol-pal system protein YbgF [Alphaproteobacteria bacterium]